MSELTLKQLVASLYYTVITDEKGYILYISDNYYDLLGVPTENIIGKYITDVIPNSEVPDILESGRQDIGALFVMPDGQTVVCNRTPIFVDKKLSGAISTATFYDISQVERLNSTITYLQEENTQIKTQLESMRASFYPPLIGVSKAIRDIRDIIQKVAASDYTVLISGETGTGKEVVASEIYRFSSRRVGPYIKINCSAIPSELMESELFGYEAGAFSGANPKGYKGKFEQANHGIILLDEISEISLPLQAKLLRVIQEKEIVRIGGNKVIKLDIKILCSTNRNLIECVRQGRFREDLYYRINVIEIQIPPLRERRGDIAPLCEYFIDQINRKNGLSITGLSEESTLLVEQHSWEGNVRELKHALEHSSILNGSGEILFKNISFLLARHTEKDDVILLAKELQQTALNNTGPTRTLEQINKQSEKENLIKALHSTGGNKSATASLLGIDRSTLYAKLRRHKLH